MAKILIIEDEQDLAELIAINVAQEGHQPVISLSGEEGLATIAYNRPDLVVLDLMMPGLTGFEVCRNLRNEKGAFRIPVIMVTARGEESDRVAGLEAGADDYVVKPFSIRELMLRIRAKLNQNQNCIDNDQTLKRLYTVGTLEIDTESHSVMVGKDFVGLTTTEFKLLTLLARMAGKVISREGLLHDVWGDTEEIDYRTVDTHITRLRNKLGNAGDLIKTVRGFGYKLDAA